MGKLLFLKDGVVPSRHPPALAFSFPRHAQAFAHHSSPAFEYLSTRVLPIAQGDAPSSAYPSDWRSVCSSVNPFTRFASWTRRAIESSRSAAAEDLVSEPSTESGNFRAEAISGTPTKTAEIPNEGQKQYEDLPWYLSAASQPKGVEVPAKKQSLGEDIEAVSTMADLFDLEKQFAFYGSYHSNKVNILIHVLFVWPIYFTSLILWAYTAPLAPLPLAGGTVPLQEYMVLNWSFIQTAVYALFYVALDKKAGSLGAALCLCCWIGANAFAQAIPWSFGWKIVLVSQLICWSAQIFGHLKFEGRAPALLDNIAQAFLMAPFFVLLEILQSFFGYEPYPGFQKSVEKKVDAAIRKFRTSQGKRTA